MNTCYNVVRYMDTSAATYRLVSAACNLPFMDLKYNFLVGHCSVTGLYTCIHMIVLTLLYLYGVVRMRLLNHSLVYTRLHHMVSEVN